MYRDRRDVWLIVTWAICSKFVQFSCLSSLFFRCHEFVVIFVVAINRQYLHTSHLFRKQIYMIVMYLYSPMFAS